jgi:hypothetical protein
MSAASAAAAAAALVKGQVQHRYVGDWRRYLDCFVFVLGQPHQGSMPRATTMTKVFETGVSGFGDQHRTHRDSHRHIRSVTSTVTIVIWVQASSSQRCEHHGIAASHGRVLRIVRLP